jgi:hypothetical protein
LRGMFLASSGSSLSIVVPKQRLHRRAWQYHVCRFRSGEKRDLPGRRIRPVRFVADRARYRFVRKAIQSSQVSACEAVEPAQRNRRAENLKIHHGGLPALEDGRDYVDVLEPRLTGVLKRGPAPCSTGEWTALAQGAASRIKSMDLEVGSVGLGLMGRPMASNLVAAGVKAQGLQSHGIEGAPLIGGTAERSYGRCFWPMRGRAGPLRRNGRDLRAQTRARTSRLQAPGVGATVNQN